MGTASLVGKRTSVVAAGTTEMLSGVGMFIFSIARSSNIDDDDDDDDDDDAAEEGEVEEGGVSVIIY